MNNVELGNALRAAREKRGFSLRDVAARLGVSDGALSNYEAGRRPLTAVMLLKLAGILRTPVGVMVGETHLDDDGTDEPVTEDSRVMGERLRQAREERGLSQAEVARAVGCSESLISRWENGQRTPKSRQLMKVMQTLGISLARVWGAHDWVAELRDPDEWPPGLREFLCSEYAQIESPVRPGQVGLLAAMATHPRWHGTKTVNDWRHAAMMLLIELGDARGVLFPDDM